MAHRQPHAYVRDPVVGQHFRASLRGTTRSGAYWRIGRTKTLIGGHGLSAVVLCESLDTAVPQKYHARLNNRLTAAAFTPAGTLTTTSSNSVIQRSVPYRV